jgi:glycosyltransferase involved in cell wall biosynthesis
MLDYTLLVPHRENPERLAALVPRFALALSGGRFEIVVVDDASGPDAVQRLRGLMRDWPELTVLRLTRPSGASAAWTHGLAAARGSIVLGWELSERVLPSEFTRLTTRLSRADFVSAVPEASRWGRLVQRVKNLPRRVLFGSPTLDAACPIWAARREAVAHLALASGQHHLLPWLVANRGYRIEHATVPTTKAEPDAYLQGRAHPLDMLSVWWLGARAQQTFVEPLEALPSTTISLPMRRAA